MICGGFKPWAPALESHQQILDSVRDAVEERIGRQSTFKALEFSSQVVAGTNWKFKVEADGGQIIHVKIHEPLPHTGKPKVLMDVSNGPTTETSFP
jgi:cystatin-A/B